MTKIDTMYYRIYYHTTSEDTMDIEMARKIFLENYFVSDYCSHEDLEEFYGVPVGKVKAFKEYFERRNPGDGMNELVSYLVDEFKENVDDDEEDEEEETTKEEEEEEDEEEEEEDEHTCVICATVIDLDEDDWHDCEKCNMTCCTDCYIYRPDIFGKSDFQENGDGWEHCEVCTKCDEEFDNTDKEEAVSILQAVIRRALNK